MSKYNFYELKGKKLPDDVNQPVIDMLKDKLQCPEAVDFVLKFQKNKACGNIQIYDKNTPKMLKITTNFGMVEGFDLVETVDTGRFIVSGSKHIKNTNLDMKKPIKEDQK